MKTRSPKPNESTKKLKFSLCCLGDAGGTKKELKEYFARALRRLVKQFLRKSNIEEI